MTWQSWLPACSSCVFCVIWVLSKKYLIFGVRDANSRGTESCALVVITAVFTSSSGLKTSPWRSPSFDRSTLSFSTSRKYYMSTPRTNKDIHWLYAERKYELLFINNNKKRNHILWSCKWTHSPPSLRQSPYLLPSVALELNKTGLSFLIAFQWLNSNRYMGEILK